MIKLFIVKCFRTLSYDKTISSLTEEEAILLSFFDENDQIKLPSGGTLHHFVKYRLGEEGINEIMMLLGEKILNLSSEKEAKIDSTPLEASRYDEMQTITHITGARWIKHILQWLGLFLFLSPTQEDLLEILKNLSSILKP